MTGRAAILTLRVMTKRIHEVGWQLSGGGAGEPGGVWCVTTHCQRLDCGLTEVKGEDLTKPCTCGVDLINSRVAEALATLQKIIEAYDKAVDFKCSCKPGAVDDHCLHCNMVIEVREMMNGQVFLNPDGN